MKTRKEYLDGAQELINQAHQMEILKTNADYVFLQKRHEAIIQSSREDVVSSTTWEEFLQKKGFLRGLQALNGEIDTIISRGKSKERILKK